MTQDPNTPAPVTERSRHLLSGKRLIGAGALVVGAMFLLVDPFLLFAEPPGIHRPDTMYEVDAGAAVTWQAPLPLPAGLSPSVRTYRHRQEAWVVDRFRTDVARFRARSKPGSPEAIVEILEGPLTPDQTADGLDDAAHAARSHDESQVVSSEMMLFVPGVSAHDLMRFHAFSLFELAYENPTQTTAAELYGPRHGVPLPFPLAEASVLPANQWLRTEATAGSFVKKATRITHAVVLDPADDVHVYRFALFLSDAPERGADAYFSHGIFLTRDVEGGAVLFTHSLFHGQEIPHMGQSFFADLIRSSYLEYGAVYLDHAAEWARAHP